MKFPVFNLFKMQSIDTLERCKSLCIHCCNKAHIECWKVWQFLSGILLLMFRLWMFQNNQIKRVLIGNNFPDVAFKQFCLWTFQNNQLKRISIGNNFPQSSTFSLFWDNIWYHFSKRKGYGYIWNVKNNLVL